MRAADISRAAALIDRHRNILGQDEMAAQSGEATFRAVVKIPGFGPQGSFNIDIKKEELLSHLLKKRADIESELQQIGVELDEPAAGPAEQEGEGNLAEEGGRDP